MWDRTPTPYDLAVWLRVASPRWASGRYRWQWGEGSTSTGYGWFGRPPVALHLPADVDVDVRFPSGGRWRLDGPDGPLARSDGARAVVWSEEGAVTGDALLLLHGPDLLLLPQEPEPTGTIEADELLGRPCWRWTDGDEVRWVDEASGTLLRLQVPGGTAVWTELELDVPYDPAVHDLGDLTGRGRSRTWSTSPNRSTWRRTT